MEKIIYENMLNQQDHHWWFVSRRLIIQKLLSNLNLNQHSKILEVGCGTGGNLSMLKAFGTVNAMEMDSYSRAVAGDVSGLNIMSGSLPNDIPEGCGKFDMICLFDVLEHVQQDKEAIERLVNLLNPKGIIFITVPAVQMLYGPHDKEHHHFRRYNKQTLSEALNPSSKNQIQLGYFNFFLFPVAVIARLIQKFSLSSGTNSDPMPNRYLNQLFKNIFSFERHLIDHIQFPIGLSLYAIYQKE